MKRLRPEAKLVHVRHPPFPEEPGSLNWVSSATRITITTIFHFFVTTRSMMVSASAKSGDPSTIAPNSSNEPAISLVRLLSVQSLLVEWKT